MSATAPIDVRVLGPVEVAHALSMRRYASELTAALGELDGVEAGRALAPNNDEAPFGATGERHRSLATRALRHLGERSRRRRAIGRVRRLNGDVFHLVDQRDAPLIPDLPEGRAVQTVHDLLGIAEQPGSPGAESMRAGLEQAGRIVAISESTRSEVLRYLDVEEERVTVIPNGVGGHFRPLPPARLAVVHDLLPNAQYRVLHVAANTQPRKNLSTTIRVLHALRQQGLDAILVRAGAPLPEADAELAAELGVAEQVANCGYVSEERLVELYNASDALLFPSSYEGFGWPPLEAMACGLPVVSSPMPAVQDISGPARDEATSDVALIADPHDIEALTNHVAAVLTDSGLAGKLRVAGLEHASRYSWDRAARAYLDVYRAILEA